MPSSRKIDIFRVANFHLRHSEKRMRQQFKKAAACINDLFMTMSNYDVRFHFDPISLDDCRCEVMSKNEVNLLCSMKEFPMQSCILQGDVTSGAVMIKFADHYTTRPDMASWEDIITVVPGMGRYLSTTKLLTSLIDVIQRSILEMSQENQQGVITCRSCADQISLFVRFDPYTRLRVNLLPMIRMRRCMEPFRKLDTKVQKVFKSFHLRSDANVGTISLVAKPNCTDQQFLWRITFNDVENRILNNPQFLCAKHCLYILDNLCARVCRSWESHGRLLRYHLQTVLLAEIKKRPQAKYWTPEKFRSRLQDVVASLCESLREKKCLNVFTDVNVFSHFDTDSLKLLAGKLSNFKANQTEISSLF